MTPFPYKDQQLYCESVALADIAFREGTPAYVYSENAILQRYREYDESFDGDPHQICYAVKANSNVAILQTLARAGAGFDIVSGGELYRVLKAGGDAARIVFSGVGKTAAEVEFALEKGIHGFNCESEPELALIDAIAAKREKVAHVALRVNPDVDASTHPYISTGLSEHKFGIGIDEVEAVYERARVFRHLSFESVSCHIGSQILDTTPMLQAIEKMIALVERLREKGFPIRYLDLGGGLGVPYRDEDPCASIRAFVGAVRERVAGRDFTVMLEPGRSIVAAAGVLLTRVLYRKHNGPKQFVIVDAAMNDLIRPALYHAHHEIVAVHDGSRPGIIADVVGPVCESGDFLARNRQIPDVMTGNLLAVRTAGAYGFALSSNYNSRPRAAEVLVNGNGYRLIRQRETYEDLVRGEQLAF